MFWARIYINPCFGLGSKKCEVLNVESNLQLDFRGLYFCAAYLPANNLRRISTTYLRGYWKGSENGRVVTIGNVHVKILSCIDDHFSFLIDNISARFGSICSVDFLPRERYQTLTLTNAE